ncbi:hypothetical protein CFP56_011856 [Quercus suber]|uniref:Uncharacterized protein n=1 Tax=Quercus suber TaxID=58331 RepID=A0AAW0KZV0_QUESU
MEITLPYARADGLIVQACAMHLRAGMEVIISKHFGVEIIDELLIDSVRKKKSLSACWSQNTMKEINSLLI